MEYSFLRRVWILQMLCFTARLKYYGVWTLTEGACILTGLGYNGVDPKTGHVDWNRLQNVNAWGVETAQNSRAYLENWNMNTNKWLRNYIYLRVTPKGKKPGFRASLATFTTSAFWHGFYPGYYLSFTLAAFIQTVAKSKSRKHRPRNCLNVWLQIFDVLSDHSSYRPTARGQQHTSLTTTLHLFLPHNSSSPSLRLPLSSSLSQTASLCGHAFTSMLFSPWAAPLPFSLHRPRHTYKSDSRGTRAWRSLILPCSSDSSARTGRLFWVCLGIPRLWWTMRSGKYRRRSRRDAGKAVR